MAEASSVLDMTTVDASDACIVCDHTTKDVEPAGPEFEYVGTVVRYGTRYRQYRCADVKACAARVAADRKDAARQVLEEIREHRENIKYLRQCVKDAEAEMARSIQEALTYSAGPTAIARAAGLSRERIYQIRDGRR